MGEWPSTHCRGKLQPRGDSRGAGTARGCLGQNKLKSGFSLKSRSASGSCGGAEVRVRLDRSHSPGMLGNAVVPVWHRRL